MWFTDEAIAAWRAEPCTTPGGQPHHPTLAITTALTMRAVSIIALLGLDLTMPDHSTLSRRRKTLTLPPLRRSGTGPLHLLVDSTGLKLAGAGEWLVEKHGASRRRSGRKLHLGGDGESGEIVAIERTRKAIDDAARSGALLDQITDPIASFTADGAYDQDRGYETVASVIGMPPSWCRHVHQQSRALAPKPLRHSATDISRTSPKAVGWAGQNSVAATFGPRSRPQLVDTNA